MQDEQFWGALVKQARQIWASPAGRQLDHLVHKAVAGLLLSTEEAALLRDDVSRGKIGAIDAHASLLSQWRAFWCAFVRICTHTNKRNGAVWATVLNLRDARESTPSKKLTSCCCLLLNSGSECGSPKVVPNSWDAVVARLSSTSRLSKEQALAAGLNWKKTSANRRKDYWYSAPQLPPVVVETKHDRRRKRADEAKLASTATDDVDQSERSMVTPENYRGLDLLDRERGKPTVLDGLDNERWDRKGPLGVLAQLDSLDSRWCHRGQDLSSFSETAIQSCHSAQRVIGKLKTMERDDSRVVANSKPVHTNTGERLRWHTKAPLDGYQNGERRSRRKLGRGSLFREQGQRCLLNESKPPLPESVIEKLLRPQANSPRRLTMRQRLAAMLLQDGKSTAVGRRPL
eukprot:SAG31_NODE_1296_length_8945_cov_6.341510_7_plen_402_part_00